MHLKAWIRVGRRHERGHEQLFERKIKAVHGLDDNLSHQGCTAVIECHRNVAGKHEKMQVTLVTTFILRYLAEVATGEERNCKWI